MGLKEFIDKLRNDANLLPYFVFASLFLDSLILTIIVPMLPEYALQFQPPIPEYETIIIPPPFFGVPPLIVSVPVAGDQSVDPLAGLKAAQRQHLSKGDSRKDDSASSLGAKQTITQQGFNVGLLFGSKAFFQLLSNPGVGVLSNKIGYTVPMFAGFCVTFASTIIFAFGRAMVLLWCARGLQGLGSACSSTAGLGLLAKSYPDEAERGKQMGRALGGLALGVLVGPTIGGILFDLVGKSVPMIFLAALALCAAVVEVITLKPRIDRGQPEGSSLLTLLMDPYVIVAAGAIFIGSVGIAALETSLPLRMLTEWHATAFQRGIAFLPAGIAYLLGTRVFGKMAHRMGRWRSAAVGLLINGLCLFTIPFATNIYHLIVPIFGMGCSIGMINAAMFPLLASLVEQRHVGVYGTIYAIACSAFCLSFVIGPFLSGPLLQYLGFSRTIDLMATITLLFAPLTLFLRNPPAVNRDEKQPLPLLSEKDYTKLDK